MFQFENSQCSIFDGIGFGSDHIQRENGVGLLSVKLHVIGNPFPPNKLLSQLLLRVRSLQIFSPGPHIFQPPVEPKYNLSLSSATYLAFNGASSSPLNPDEKTGSIWSCPLCPLCPICPMCPPAVFILSIPPLRFLSEPPGAIFEKFSDPFQIPSSVSFIKPWSSCPSWPPSATAWASNMTK